jgi:hypothetical protein
MKEILRFLLSGFSMLLGLIVGLVEIFALIDPVGTKMADDADPFGNPHEPWYKHAIYIAFVIGCFLVSFLLVRQSPQLKKL